MLYKKYRPKNLYEFFGNDTTKLMIQRIFSRPNAPREILIDGPSGTGKTTLARIVASMIRGTSVETLLTSIEYLEINVPQWQAKDLVKNLFKHHHFPPLGIGFHVRVYDEFSAATHANQSMFLKLIENSHQKFVHFFIVSNLTDTIKPLVNRCVQLSLRPLEETEMVKLLAQIANAECTAVDERVLREIARVAKGIPRQAITMLEQIIDSPIELQAEYLVARRELDDASIVSKPRTRQRKANL